MPNIKKEERKFREYYKSELAKIEQGQAEIAMVLYYFSKKVLYELPECSGDMFGIGEDDLIMEFYPHVKLIITSVEQASKEGKKIEGLKVYDAYNLMAECFVLSIVRQNARPMEFELPEIDEFELDVLRVIEHC